MTAGQVILLRHGLTDWNDAGRFQGQYDVPLNQTGRAQAAAAAEALAGLGITRIVSSDLARAAATATIVGERLGLAVGFDPRLQEINVGSWAGLTPSEISQVDPELWGTLLSGNDGRHSATGETANAAGQRVADALVEHAGAASEDETLLVIGHGLTTRVASLMLLGLDYSHARILQGISNCHWVVLRPGSAHWRLVAYNRGA